MKDKHRTFFTTLSVSSIFCALAGKLMMTSQEKANCLMPEPSRNLANIRAKLQSAGRCVALGVKSDPELFFFRLPLINASLLN